MARHGVARGERGAVLVGEVLSFGGEEGVTLAWQ